jgi:hypothetical protein
MNRRGGFKVAMAGAVVLGACALTAPRVLRGQQPAQRTKPRSTDQAAPPGGERQPVLVYAYARFTDHVNLGVTEARLRRVLTLIDTYHQKYPEAHVCATIMLSGAMSRALEDDNAKTGTKDYLLSFARRGLVELGYDGADEPTYKTRPVVDVVDAKDREDEWMARAKVAKEVLTQGRDPLTGALQPGTAGGLEEMQRVFGKAAVVNVMLNVDSPNAAVPGRGTAETKAVEPEPAETQTREPGLRPRTGVMPEVGGDAELAQQVASFDPNALMFGLPAVNPYHVAGFTGSEMGFGKLMSPVPETSPEIYWQDNVLRTSDGSDEVLRLIHASDGAEAISKVMDRLARSRIRVVHVELGSERDSLNPDWLKTNTPLQFAYDHPDHPELPAEALRNAKGVDAAFANDESTLKWLVSDFFRANPGSRFVSNAELRDSTPPSTGFSVSTESLRTAVGEMLNKWGRDTYPPPYLQVDHQFLSLADLFQVMTDEFADYNRTGKMPSSVKVVQVYGPLKTILAHGPNVGEVTLADVARTCAELQPALHQNEASPVPKNHIPSGVKVGGIDVNAAQFLRLMAGALVAPSADTKLEVRMTYLLPGQAWLMPKTRPLTDMGEAWTIKPAPLEVGRLMASDR